MIDYISIKYNVTDVQKYLNNTAFGKWTLSVDKESSEIEKYFAKIGNLGVTLYHGHTVTTPPWIEVKGSIHKYCQGGNIDDFTKTDLKNVLNYFEHTLKIDPKTATIQAFEFGVNVETDVPPPEIFCHYVSFRNEPFKPMAKPRSGARHATGVYCERSEMWLKVYDKGTQYNKDRYVLRYEYKVLRMRNIQSQGVDVVYLSDLLKNEVLTRLKDVLIGSYDGIQKTPQIVDMEKVKALSGKDFSLFHLGRNPQYWYELKERCKGTRNPKLKNDWQRFETISKAVIQTDTEKIIRSKIIDKWDYLQTDHLNKKGVLFTCFEDEYNKIVTKAQNRVITLTLCVNYTPFRVLLDVQKERFLKRICILCETDISQRRSDAMTCSKSCRNSKSNAYQDYTKRLRKDVKTALLFDVCEFVDLSVLERKQKERVER